MSWMDGLYQRVPQWAQVGLLNAYALRRRSYWDGPAFRRLAAEWEDSQWWVPAAIRTRQDERVRTLVQLAHDRVPFYRERWDAHGVNVGQIQGVADLPRLPVLTKADVRNAGDALRARPLRRLLHGHTSGTTGSPLSLWYDRSVLVANTVAYRRQQQWAGMTATDWCALFLGRVVVPIDQPTAPFWRPDYVQRQLWCSSFHLAEDTLPIYVRELRRRNIRFIEGYPSTLFILARHLIRHGERLPLQGVLTSSETLHQVQRETLTEAFGAPVFDFYGLAERTLFAGECALHGGKHLFDEYGVTEITNRDGSAAAPGESGILTGTSLWNFGMPLIRYQTSDVSRLLAEPCACGRGLSRLADVTTKAEDIVVTPDGRFVSPSVLTHPFKPFDQILKSQIVQDAPDHVVVSIVPSAAFTAEQRAQLEAGLRERLGTAMRIETRLVDEIPAETSGKFRWVVCRVPHDRMVNWEAPPR
jgi:phenylacetate-coenzyme A ligase PaaK-like adenylate-forming protein